MDTNQLSHTITALVALVKRLREPGGCPWDAKQTDDTIKSYMLEEAYEALDAIEKRSPEDTCQELGDLLFHIVFLARLAEERNEFTLIDVLEKITEKMVRRHPHVFGEVRIKNAEDVVDQWANIKEKEKNSRSDHVSYLGAIPKNQPALMWAHRLCERAEKRAPSSPTPDHLLNQLIEGLETLKTAASEKNKDHLCQELGHVLFGLANLTRLLGFNSEQILRDANRKFIEQFESAPNRLPG